MSGPHPGDQRQAASGPIRHPLGKVRGPVSVWLLSIITFGIYSLVWHYSGDRELWDFAPEAVEVSPGVCLFAVTLGSFIVVPPFVSVLNTGGRIAKAQGLAGLSDLASGGIGILLMFVFGLTPLYYQSQLNKVWHANGA
ncbi:DUF4234 domain-containing protein [Nocardiopsis ansamitocini]|nr:DUF4234 domain-containing protein [Nocardiopsis ansamitocini]